MKNIVTPIKLTIAFVALLLVIILTYASIWGENNKSDAAIKSFFDHVQTQNYFSLDDNLQIIESLEVFDTGGDYSENCFLLELVLLEKFNLTNASSYKVKTEKNGFWIPFIGEPNIKVDITLNSTENGILSTVINNSKNNEPIKNLFTLSRINGSWRISSINLKKSSLIADFNRIKTSLSIDNVVKRVGSKINVLPMEIETKNLSTIEKRKLNYIFQKINYEIKEANIHETK